MGSLRPKWNRDPQGWYPHPELNGNPRFRKPLLYPFELWGLGTLSPECKMEYNLGVQNGHSQNRTPEKDPGGESFACELPGLVA